MGTQHYSLLLNKKHTSIFFGHQKPTVMHKFHWFANLVFSKFSIWMCFKCRVWAFITVIVVLDVLLVFVVELGAFVELLVFVTVGVVLYVLLDVVVELVVVQVVVLDVLLVFVVELVAELLVVVIVVVLVFWMNVVLDVVVDTVVDLIAVFGVSVEWLSKRPEAHSYLAVLQLFELF